MSLRFTNIAETLPYPPKLKATLQKYHTDIISYCLSHFESNKSFKTKIIGVMNNITLAVMQGDSISLNTSSDVDTLYDSVFIDNSIEVADYLGDLYIVYSKVKWDVEEHIADSKPATKVESKPKPTKPKTPKIKPPTAKEDLYLRAPTIPHIDLDKPWLNFFHNGAPHTLYTTSPIVPTTQREISLTTDISRMGSGDLLNLFPNRFIPTRAPVMYNPIDDLEFDDKLGIILPIEGFTSEQVRHNIIQYPHLYKLDRWIGDSCVSFYSNIEINDSLYDTLEVWDSLPESKVIPKTQEFIKEYVARRYLLERDNGVKHKYPLRGTLDPFLTLFTTPEDYRYFGYGDPLELAERCVKARVAYWTTRNPVLNLYKNPTLPGCASANCIYKSYCSKAICDNACPTLVETSYLRERNGLTDNTQVFREKPQVYDNLLSTLHSENMLNVLISDNTVATANALTYAAVCENWQGNRLHCTVYHLRFSNYIESVQRSWGLKEMPESLEYEQIWLSQAKVLIISSLDYIQFKDFHAQTILNIIQDRTSHNLPTYIVSPKITSLVGSGIFFGRLKQIMEGGVVK